MNKFVIFNKFTNHIVYANVSLFEVSSFFNKYCDSKTEGVDRRFVPDNRVRY